MSQDLQSLLALIGEGGKFHAVKKRGGIRWAPPPVDKREHRKVKQEKRKGYKFIPAPKKVVAIPQDSHANMNEWLAASHKQDAGIRNSRTIVYREDQ